MCQPNNKILVVSDGGKILGIGTDGDVEMYVLDLTGIGGRGISVAKKGAGTVKDVLQIAKDRIKDFKHYAKHEEPGDYNGIDDTNVLKKIEKDMKQ